MKTVLGCAISACLAFSSTAQAQSPEAIIYMEFVGSATGSSDTNAVENAVRAAEAKAATAGYGACNLTKYSYYYWSTWNATATVVCTKDSTPTPPPPPPPGEPAIMLPIQRAPDGAHHLVSWRSPNNCNRHALNRRVNGGGWQEILKKDNVFSWDADLFSPATYDYKVLALCSSGAGTWSEIASIVISPAPVQPTPPQSSAVVGPNHTITWSAVPSADSYRLERAAGDGWESVYIGPNTSWSVEQVPAGTYRYRIVACTNGSCSAPSGITELRVVADMTPIITYLIGN